MDEFDGVQDEEDEDQFEDAMENIPIEMELDVEAEEEDLEDSEEESVGENEEPVAFDTRATCSHGYLYRHENPDSVATPEISSPCWLEGNEESEVPTLLMNLVVLPGQVMPIQTVRPVDRAALRMAINQKIYIAVRTCFPRRPQNLNNAPVDPEENRGSIGTLMVVQSYVDDGLCIKAVMKGRQRCRFLTPISSINGVQMFSIRVIPEYTFVPFSTAFCPQSALKHPEAHKLKMAVACSPHSKIAALSCALEKNMDLLVDWLRMWFQEEIIALNRSQGPECFSYWAAINVPVDMESKYKFLAEGSTDSRIALLLQTVKKLTSLVCSNCKSQISSMDKVVNMSTESTSSHFVNNYGFVHETLTVSEADRVLPQGVPIFKYTWYPGYKWQIIVCGFCAKHVGWEFTSQRYNPPKFYGLSRNSVMPQKVEDY